MNNLDYIHSHKGFEKLDLDNCFDLPRDFYHNTGVDKTSDEMTKLIFAPDPITGNPSSDIGLLMSKQAEPAVVEYIRTHLATPVQEVAGASSPDEAEACSPHRGETRSAYISRLRDIVRSTAVHKQDVEED